MANFDINIHLTLLNVLASLPFLAVICAVSAAIYRLRRKKRPETYWEYKALEDLPSRFSHFAHEAHNEIEVKLSTGHSEVMSHVSITIDLHANWPSLNASKQSPITLMKLWSDWPPFVAVDRQSRDASGRTAVIVEDVVTPAGVVVEAAISNSERLTHLNLVSSTQGQTEPILRVQFSCPNVFYVLPGPYPFEQRRLSLYMTIEPESVAERTLIALDHPKDIGLRWRKDNADYYSFSIDMSQNEQRNYFFFPCKHLSLRCTYGTNDSRALAGPGLPLLYSGFGVLTAAFAFLLLAKQGATFIAAFAFALTLSTWFIEGGIRRRRLFSPSAMVSHVSWTVFSTLICLFIHVFYLFIIGIIYVVDRKLAHSVAISGFVIAIALLLMGVGYFVALQLGMLLGFRCDECEDRVLLRRHRLQIIPDTRQSVHPAQLGHNCLQRATSRAEQARTRI